MIQDISAHNMAKEKTDSELEGDQKQLDKDFLPNIESNSE